MVFLLINQQLSELNGAFTVDFGGEIVEFRVDSGAFGSATVL